MKVAVSVGDLNGIGIELALRHHTEAKEICDPLYLIDREMLEQAAKLLKVEIPNDFVILSPGADPFEIRPGEVSAEAGAYSFASFESAVELATQGKVAAVCTLPIHKQAWEKAGIRYKGHTDALRDFFDAEAIMMLGCPELFVALYTEHIPLRQVPAELEEERLLRFLLDFHRTANPEGPVGVLGLNPHAGDGGVLGDEERIIERTIARANEILRSNTHRPTSNIQHPTSIFEGPLVPDVAFVPWTRKRYRHYVAIYHDQGLAPLKALHFDESINVSLCLPILRTSVDHGTAFDIAYRGKDLNPLSYLNALRFLAEHTGVKD
ncbi:4-hydroxythreonine-4-phosphate dehydrogenase [Nitratifractor sp.]